MTRYRLFVAALAILPLSGAGTGFAAKLTSARVTQVVRDVQVVNRENARPATVGDSIRGETAVATGRLSRAELEFNDRTLLRLGSNTTFSLSNVSRTVELKKGSVLLQTAPGSGGVDIRAGSITAAITGSLGFFSVSDPTDPALVGKEMIVKLISIHGAIGLKANGKTYNLQPFQILVARVDMEGNLIGEPETRNVDGSKLLATSKLVNGFPGNDRIDNREIFRELNGQSEEKKDNQWRVVPSSPADPGADPGRHQTVGLNALVRRFLPMGKGSNPPTTQRRTSPKSQALVRVFPPGGKQKGKGKRKGRPKSKPKPKPKPDRPPYPNPTTPPKSTTDIVSGAARPSA